MPDSERNPNVQEDVKRTIERASQPIPAEQEKHPRRGDYTDTQTRSHKAEGTSAKRSDTSHPENA